MTTIPSLRASAVQRAALCPGSRRMEAPLPDQSSRDSEAGARAHALAAQWLATGAAPPDDGSQEWSVAADFIEIVSSCLEGWPPATGVSETLIEQEFSAIGEGMKVFLTGHPDAVILDDGRAFIPDLKALWGEHPASARNLQLRAYAVLVADNYDVTEVTACIIQPRISRTPEICVYGPDELARARAEIEAIEAASRAPDAPLAAGAAQCAYCKARAICPGAAEFATLAATGIPIPGNPPLERGEAQQIVETLTLAQIGQVWGMRLTVEKIYAAMQERLLAASEQELEEIGLTLKPGAERRSITDARAAFERLAGELSADQFAACCNVKISELQTMYRMAVGKPVREANPEFEAKLAGLIERKQTAPSLVKMKGSQ